MLPPEILLRIFEYVHDWQRRPFDGNSFKRPRTTLLSVVLVCKAWNSLAEPLLYRQISLDCEPYSKKAFLQELLLNRGLSMDYQSYNKIASCQERLRDSLKQEPYRYEFVEDLALTSSSRIRGDRDEEFPETIAKMTNLRAIRLELEENKPPPDGAITISISSMPKLENLVAYEAWTGSVLRQIMNSESDYVFPALKRWDLFDAKPLEADCRLPKSREYTSKLEFLYVFGDCHSSTLYELFKWPQALKRFSMSIRTDRCRYATSYTTNTIQRVLDLQFRNLEEIYLPAYSHQGQNILPKLAHFSSLTLLELSHYEVFESDPKTAVDKLCSPTLEIFNINMDIEDQQVFGYTAFKETHADWLLNFARSYRDLDGKGSLHTIHIEYCWDDEYDWYHAAFDTPWPNACMTALRPKIAEYGFDLTWPKPGMTEEDWFGPDRQKRCLEAMKDYGM